MRGHERTSNNTRGSLKSLEKGQRGHVRPNTKVFKESNEANILPCKQTFHNGLLRTLSQRNEVLTKCHFRGFVTIQVLLPTRAFYGIIKVLLEEDDLL